MKLLVTQSFGRENEYKRVILSILSFWAIYSGDKSRIKTVLSTDKPDYFKSYFEGIPVEYIVLTPDKIKIMRGQIDFIHRMKIALIEEAFQRHPGADMLYMDSDTIFLKDPKILVENIHGNNSFMHLVEFSYDDYKKFANQRIGEANHLAFIELLENKKFTTSAGEEEFHSLTGWNAGVMGLPAKVADFLPDIYALTDAFYLAAPLNGSEQAAFSYILQTRTILQDCEEYVYHYWGIFKKQIIDSVLSKIIDKKFSNLNLTQRLAKIKKFIEYVPLVVKTHEDALHFLNSGHLLLGCKYSITALRMAPVNKYFIKHLIYHVKKHVTSIFN